MSYQKLLVAAADTMLGEKFIALITFTIKVEKLKSYTLHL